MRAARLRGTTSAAPGAPLPLLNRRTLIGGVIAMVLL
jgi:hypothetical protein